MSNYSARSLRDLNIGTSYANVASFVGRVLSSAIFILFGLSKLSALQQRWDTSRRRAFRSRPWGPPSVEKRATKTHAKDATRNLDNFPRIKFVAYFEDEPVYPLRTASARCWRVATTTLENALRGHGMLRAAADQFPSRGRFVT
jgi:hypothetical protein